jgi:sulfopyruvate decarboxylase TPP-binding subunit
MGSQAMEARFASAEEAGEGRAGFAGWAEIMRDCLKRNEVQLVTYVPDRVLTPLIDAVEADPYFNVLSTAREEEAVGIVCGSWMAGLRGVVLMQTSGFATLANVLASLPLAYQIPVLMIISERGTLGEFNRGQALVCRTMRPILDSMGMSGHTLTNVRQLDFVVDRTIKQVFGTHDSAALIISPLLSSAKF